MAKHARFPEPTAVIELQRLVNVREAELAEQLRDSPNFGRLYGLGNPPTIGLLGTRAEPKSRRKLAPATDPLGAQIRSHPVFRWLESIPGFTKARRAFTSRKLSDDADDTEAIVEVRFLRDVLMWFALAAGASATGWKPKEASARQKQTAKKHAQALLQDLEHVGFNNVLETDALKRLLVGLCTDLEGAARSYSGPKALERQVLEGLSGACLRVSGLSRGLIVDIVEGLAEAFGFDTSHRSIQRYVASARRQRSRPPTYYLGGLTTGSCLFPVKS